ncbi:hypothetical protein NIES4072_70920 [Nostoc commune NIES-4072]|uniref:Uncharacterized protein n=1 Tax=Nostoc commune NIES-4072 TaxID=2005467 RepID=A0A2R5FXD3_NOSCO|nr:hypothetical protein [Nostoc commune]BBD70726.1 hypothetical protein NIES4070_71370 [Nostoc commune HK-02]GBG23380.1 hypothetical protein NIES4072_70920 [Nostoc commune NIES-4072]
MKQNLITQEFGIIIAAKNHNPTILNPDFLKYSGIVPQEWELLRQPIYTQNVSQLAFTNGIMIVAEPTRVIFIEAIEQKAIKEITVAEIAKKYVQTLPNVQYEAIGLNPRGYISFEQQDNAASQYLAKTFLSGGDWQSLGTTPVRATLNLVYTLERCPFYLTVSEAALRNPDETNIPIILFNGSFSYEVKSEKSAERVVNLHDIIDNWQTDLSNYQEIINTKILLKSEIPTTVVPDVFTMNHSVVA